MFKRLFRNVFKRWTACLKNGGKTTVQITHKYVCLAYRWEEDELILWGEGERTASLISKYVCMVLTVWPPR